MSTQFHIATISQGYHAWEGDSFRLTAKRCRAPLTFGTFASLTLGMGPTDGIGFDGEAYAALLGGDLGDGGAGGALVDDRLLVGEGGDERLDREIVEQARQPAACLVQERSGIVLEEGVVAAGELGLVA